MTTDHNPEQETRDLQTFLSRSGEDPQLWQVEERWWRRGTAFFHIGLTLTGPGGRQMIYKQVIRSDRPDHYLKTVDAQENAARVLSGPGSARAPAVLFRDDDLRAFSLEKAPGLLIEEAAFEADDAPVLFRKVGSWLAEFHRATLRRDHPFPATATTQPIAVATRRLAAGERSAPMPQRLLSHARRFAETVVPKVPARTTSAVIHGDFHLRNLLVDGDTLWGIDFAHLTTAPVAVDVAHFLINYMVRNTEFADLAPGQVVDPTIEAAFFDGYGLLDPADPIYRYYLLRQILTLWFHLPQNPAKLTFLDQYYLERLSLLAERGLADT